MLQIFIYRIQRQMMKIDTEFFSQEVMGLKLLSLGVQPKNAITTSSILVELGQQEVPVELLDPTRLNSGQTGQGSNSGNVGVMPYVDAALLLLRDLKLKYRDKSDEEILVELKKMQQELEE